MGGGRGAAGPVSAPALLALFAAIAIGIYWPSLRGDWVFDDNPAIVANDALGDTAGAAVRALAGRRTLTDFTFALNRAAGGLDPFGYHLVNVLLHAVNAWLVFLLARVLGRRLGVRKDRTRFAAPAAALLFLCHPLLSQAVAYTAQRYTSLATCFYLATILLYVAARERRSLFAGALALFTAFLAMRCKEIAFTLPVAVLLAEFALFRSGERRPAAAVPFLLLLPLIPLSLLMSDEGASHSLARETLASFREAPGIGRVEYLSTQFVVLVRYGGLLVVPAGLTIDHHVELLPGPWHGAALAAAIGIAATGLVAWRLRRTHPLATFAWVWFFLTAAVESSIVPIRDLMVEHRAYLPSVGLFVAVGYALSCVPARRLALGVVLVALSIGTWNRARVWSGPVALWEDALRKSPESAMARVNLALAHRRAGRYETAAWLYGEAIEREPALVEAMFGLGLSLDGIGSTTEALEIYRRARRVAEDYGPVYGAEAELLHRTGRRDEAIALLQEGHDKAGADLRRSTLLGDCLVEASRPGEAIEAYRRALDLDPGVDRRGERAAVGLARVLVDLGRAAEAEEVLVSIAMRAGASAHVWNALGLVRIRSGDGAGAERAFREALRIDPAMPEARANLSGLAR